MVAPPLMTEKFHSQRPVCIETSHSESNVDKLGSSQKKCDAVIKMTRNPGIVEQLSQNVKI